MALAWGLRALDGSPAAGEQVAIGRRTHDCGQFAVFRRHDPINDSRY
jgi:hypothetical protein